MLLRRQSCFLDIFQRFWLYHLFLHNLITLPGQICDFITKYGNFTCGFQIYDIIFRSLLTEIRISGERLCLDTKKNEQPKSEVVSKCFYLFFFSKKLTFGNVFPKQSFLKEILCFQNEKKCFGFSLQLRRI